VTPHQIQLVQSSFSLVEPIAPLAAEIFYARLFSADPSLRALFKGDMAHQGERLMTMISAAVGALDRPEALKGTLRSLGRRHAGYGVQAGHYATVGAALLGTLQQGLGEAFTAEVRGAWTALYGVISETMLDAAREVEVA